MEPKEFETRDPHLRAHFKAVWRRKWVVVLVALGVFGVWTWRTLQEPPVYESAMTIQLGLPSNANVVSQLGGLFAGSRSPEVESEMEILRSRMIAQRTAMRLQRHFTILPLPQGVSLNLAEAAIADTGRPGAYTVTFPDDTRHYQVTGPDGSLIGDGRPGQPFSAGGVSFTLLDVTAKAGDSLQILFKKPSTVAAALQSKLRVTGFAGTNIVRLKVRANDPNEAAQLANAFGETYVEFTHEQHGRKVLSTKQFLDEQIEPLRKDLLKAEKVLTEYKASVRRLAPEAGLMRVIKQLTVAEIAGEKLALDRRQMEANLELLRRRSSEGSKDTVAWMTRIEDPLVSGLAQELSTLGIQRATLRQAYTSRHPRLALLDHQIAETRNLLSAQLQAGVTTSIARERLLAERIRRYTAELRDLPPSELRLFDLVRNAEVKVEVYTYLLKKQNEMQLAQASQVGGARIIDRGLPPQAPISPNVPQQAAQGGMIGLFLGIGCALFLNYLDRSVRDVKDLETLTGLPSFGVIPEIFEKRQGRWARLEKREAALPAIGKLVAETGMKHRRAAEAYRALRTNIQFATPDTTARAFLFTSGSPGEGKSLTVANLAISLSQTGRRILVLDTDLRKPAQHALFRTDADVGVTDVLSRNLAWHEATRPTGVQNVDLMPSGPIPPNPSELLGRQAMRVLLEEAKQHYDLILIDSTPILPFTDPCVLAPLVDGVFLVVRAGRTTSDAVTLAQSHLAAVQAKVAGTILNGISSANGIGPFGDPYKRYYAHYYGGAQASDKDDRGWLRRISRRILSRARR